LSETDGSDNEHNVPEFKPWNQYSPQVVGRGGLGTNGDSWQQNTVIVLTRQKFGNTESRIPDSEGRIRNRK